MRSAIVGLIVSAAFPALASNPGEPLDCSDWISVAPGFACSVFSPSDQIGSQVWRVGKGASLVADNEGNLLTLRFTFTDTFGGPDTTLGRIELLRTNGQSEEVVGRFQDRQHPDGKDHIRPDYYYDWSIARGTAPSSPAGYLTESIAFDPVNGRVIVSLRSYCSNCGGADPIYPDRRWFAAIEGFATLFEIIQSYDLPSNDLGFHVPAHPEGFEHADWFDSYWGTLASVGDWSEAQPLQCSYPPTPPSVGDYLTVADTLPTPQPGGGYYYVTAVTFQGQTRYGRKSDGGQLSGRDPAVLPACE